MKEIKDWKDLLGEKGIVGCLVGKKIEEKRTVGRKKIMGPTILVFLIHQKMGEFLNREN